MTEAERLTCKKPGPMLAFMRRGLARRPKKQLLATQPFQQESEMAARFFTRQELHERLIQKGQGFNLSTGYDVTSTDICPSENTIVTTALEPDPTLKPKFRLRYFIYTRDSAGNLAINHDPSYRLPKLDELMLDPEKQTPDFIRGPVRWVISRLMKSVKVLVWPREDFIHSDKDWISKGLDTTNACNPWDAQPWTRSFGPVPHNAWAIGIDLTDSRDLRLFVELAYAVSTNCFDLFASDHDCSEVYILHHHDKVVVSVPDHHRRNLLLNQLYHRPDLFEDSSGY